MPRPLLATLLALAASASGCAAVSHDGRDARLRRALDGYEIARPLDEVWPRAMQLLAARGYELVGDDRKVVGQSGPSLLGRLLGKGFSTQLVHGVRTLETDWVPEDRRSYRMQGFDSGHGSCRIVYTLVKRDVEIGTENPVRDVDLELALVQSLAPEDAARLLTAAER